MSDSNIKKSKIIPHWGEVVSILSVSAAIQIVFAMFGNGSHKAAEGPSLLRWIDHQWRPSNQDFSHGWFMLAGVLALSDWRLKKDSTSPTPWYLRSAIFAALAAINFLLVGALEAPDKWLSIKTIAAETIPYLRNILWYLFFTIFLYQAWLHRQSDEKDSSGHTIGVILLALSLAGHWAMYWAQQPRISLVCLAGAMWSVCLTLYGWRTAKFMLFPIGYMLICFLAWFLQAITMPLRLIASMVAESIITGMGIDIVRIGTVITSAVPGRFTVNVADACSGLRSLSIMTALAAPYAYFVMRTTTRKWLLFLCSVPLAMLANSFRVVLLTGCAAWLNDSWFQIAHDYSGLIVFALSLLLLFSAGSALNVDYHEKIRKWKQSATSRT